MIPFSPADPRRRRAGWLCAMVGGAVMAVMVGAGLSDAYAQSSPAEKGSDSRSGAISPAIAVAQPLQASDAAAQVATPGEKARQTERAAIGNPQQQEIADECAQLLKMATALKTEVDKSTKDTLSVTVVRKANEIEQLAHKVRSGTGKS